MLNSAKRLAEPLKSGKKLSILYKCWAYRNFPAIIGFNQFDFSFLSAELSFFIANGGDDSGAFCLCCTGLMNS